VRGCFCWRRGSRAPKLHVNWVAKKVGVAKIAATDVSVLSRGNTSQHCVVSRRLSQQYRAVYSPHHLTATKRLSSFFCSHSGSRYFCSLQDSQRTNTRRRFFQHRHPYHGSYDRHALSQLQHRQSRKTPGDC
jgi:hypothetical protein